MKLLMILIKDNYKESTTSCPFTKASTNSHYFSFLCFIVFCFVFFRAQYQWLFFSFFVFVTHNIATTRTALHCVHSTKLSPVQWHSYLAGWPNTNTLCCNNFFFLFCYFYFLCKVILVTADIPALFNVFSGIYQLFVHIISPCPYLSVSIYNTV